MAGLTSGVLDAQGIPGFDATLEARLLTSLRAENEQASNCVIRLAITAADGTLLAGLSGRTSYGWLHLDMVWVAPQHQRRGHARALVHDACDRAFALGCHAAWLDTSSPTALIVWQKLGFVEFGRLENTPTQRPAGHRRWFLQKTLTGPVNHLDACA